MPEEPYAVICPACHGRMFSKGVLCWKCCGDGRILIVPRGPAWPIRLRRWLRDRIYWLRWFGHQ
jgi:hypothetical protein